MSNYEMDWKDLPLVKITDRDRSLARMILSGTPQDESTKMTRGFLYYQIIEGEFVHSKDYEKFIKLGTAYLRKTWPSIKDWDEAVKGMTKEMLEWEPHLEAYVLFTKAQKRIPKAQ